MSELVVVGRFSYRHDAEFARGFLVSAGIPAETVVDDAGGHVVFSNTATLVVREEHAEHALKVLEESGVDPGLGPDQ